MNSNSLADLPVFGGETEKADPALVRWNLGCGRDIKPGWVNIDGRPAPGVDLVADLDSPFSLAAVSNDSVDEFLLCHVLEHIHDTLPLMEELHRIAKPTAVCTIRVPYGSSDDAYEDPTHVRAYFLQSFEYFSQPYYWRADYGYRGDWRSEPLRLLVHKEAVADLYGDKDAILHRVRTQRNIVAEMVATLRPVKPIREPLKDARQPLRLSIELV